MRSSVDDKGDTGSRGGGIAAQARDRGPPPGRRPAHRSGGSKQGRRGSAIVADRPLFTQGGTRLVNSICKFLWQKTKMESSTPLGELARLRRVLGGCAAHEVAKAKHAVWHFEIDLPAAARMPGGFSTWQKLRKSCKSTILHQI